MNRLKNEIIKIEGESMQIKNENQEEFQKSNSELERKKEEEFTCTAAIAAPVLHMFPPKTSSAK